MTALPFQASTPSVELTLSASFSPRLLLGISFFSGSATAGAGFFLNTPSISTTLSTVTHVDSQCENVSNSSSAASERTFDALTHIDSSVEVALGVIAQAEVDFEGSGRLKDEAEYTVLGKTFDLPTACVGFDAAAKTYGAPAQAVKTGSGMEGPKASANSAVGTKILLGVGDEGFGRLAMALGAVMAVFVLF